MDLLEWTAQIYPFWNSPIFLCGSALHEKNPQDYDIRIVMPDKQFEKMVSGPVDKWVMEGDSGIWTNVRHIWSSICTSFAKDGRYKTGLNIDFQVYPFSYDAATYRNDPKQRLFPRKGVTVLLELTREELNCLKQCLTYRSEQVETSQRNWIASHKAPNELLTETSQCITNIFHKVLEAQRK
jgi:hypothetical protein